MASNKSYVSAGVKPSKLASVTPTANVNTDYMAAGATPAWYDDSAPPAGPVAGAKVRAWRFGFQFGHDLGLR
jgi:hypothetical protein